MSHIYEGRSHRRLLRDIEKASDRRERLFEAGKVSLPTGLGKLSIIVSRAPDKRSRLTPEEQHKAFLEEAARLEQDRSEYHQQVDLRPIAVISDLKMVLADSETTDIILIGHGSLGCLHADGGRYFDWRDAARSASYLKQGKIEQRMCGNLPPKDGKIGDAGSEKLPHKYAVALGTFVVTDLTNVLAATGREVAEVDPPDELFQPVYSGLGTVSDNIHALNQRYGGQPTIRSA